MMSCHNVPVPWGPCKVVRWWRNCQVRTFHKKKLADWKLPLKCLLRYERGSCVPWHVGFSKWCWTWIAGAWCSFLNHPGCLKITLTKPFPWMRESVWRTDVLVEYGLQSVVTKMIWRDGSGLPCRKGFMIQEAFKHLHEVSEELGPQFFECRHFPSLIGVILACSFLSPCWFTTSAACPFWKDLCWLIIFLLSSTHLLGSFLMKRWCASFLAI